MNTWPIIIRDLRLETRGRRLSRGRVIAGLTAGVTFAVALCAERWSNGFSLVALMRVTPISALAPLVLFFLGLNRGVNLLSAERREGTLPLLILTKLSGHDIVAGRLLQSLAVELSLLLSITPALVLPLAMAGCTGLELGLIGLGCLNVLFFSMALGLLVSIFVEGGTAASACLLLLLPLMLYSSPIGSLLPNGRVSEFLAAFQWLNPCSALIHVQSTVAGLRPGAFWTPLLLSHALGWGFFTTAGLLLPWSCRWQASRQVRRRWRGWFASKRASTRALWPAWRTRLLDRNPFLWLAAREPWPTFHLWLMLLLPSLGWVWLIWLAWVVRGVNITIVLVIAAVVTWLVSLLAAVPREASRRLVEDRNSGALELLLCTPLDTKGIIRGQWLCLRRRYLLPLALVLAFSAVLMGVGYITFGFGGMLDPEDRGVWLFAWLSGIGLLPFSLAALCWVAMRRAMVARNVGEATGIALLQVLGAPGFALWCLYLIGSWADANLEWWWVALLFIAAFGATPILSAWRARSLLFRQLRQSAADRY